MIKKLARTFFLVFAMVSAIAATAQDFTVDTARSLHAGFQPRKFDFNLSAGSMFSTTSGYGSGLSTYVTPSVSYALNRKLRIGGGISMITTNYFNAKPWYSSESTPGFSGNLSSAVVFVNGQYLLSDRLSITGSAFKEIPLYNDPLPYNPYYPVSGQGAQGINLNVEYRIGKNATIQAGFGYSKGVNPWCADPFRSDPFSNTSMFPGSPYRW